MSDTNFFFLSVPVLFINGSGIHQNRMNNAYVTNPVFFQLDTLGYVNKLKFIMQILVLPALP